MISVKVACPVGPLSLVGPLSSVGPAPLGPGVSKPISLVFGRMITALASAPGPQSLLSLAFGSLDMLV